MLFLIVLLLFSPVVFLTGSSKSQCYETCPDDWLRFQDSCYWVGNQQYLTFIDAASLCRQRGAHLIHVNSQLENTFIKEVLRKTSAGKSWMGLTDMDIEGIWRWHDSNEIAVFTDWLTGQPDTHGGHEEDCALFGAHSFLWEDYSCDRHYQPVCEKNMCTLSGIVG